MSSHFLLPQKFRAGFKTPGPVCTFQLFSASSRRIESRVTAASSRFTVALTLPNTAWNGQLPRPPACTLPPRRPARTGSAKAVRPLHRGDRVQQGDLIRTAGQLVAAAVALVARHQAGRRQLAQYFSGKSAAAQPSPANGPAFHAPAVFLQGNKGCAPRSPPPCKMHPLRPLLNYTCLI